MRSPRILLVGLLALVLPLLAATPSGATTPLPSKSQWLRDVATVMEPAIPYLEQRVARGGDDLAIVLDIDNTSLASHYAWPRPVRRTLAFAQRAHELGVKVIFVTGRKQKDADAQKPKLRKAGYTINGMCGRRAGEGLAHSKIRCRTRIEEKRGLNIIASVGNLPSDFRGGHYERGFDLPDYDRQLS